MLLSSRHPTELSGQAAKAFTYPRASAGAANEAGQDAQGKSVWAGAGGSQLADDAMAAEQLEKQTWTRGFEEGSASGSLEHENSLATSRSEIGKTLREFAVERDSYFHRVEQEVVRLTLAIARKILHREAQVDPLLLTGVLRVALEKVGAGTGTRLRANPADIKIWRDYFTQASENFPVPELIGDPELERYRCILETEIGTTEIGLETQLKEIEQGFLDLLSQRPGSV
jgi:flagellar assembly protein FliH